MHYGTVWLLTLGILAIMATMAGWWRNVIREAHVGHHNPVVAIGLRYGMALFITSEVMFFAAFFWAFFNAALYPTEPTGGACPTEGVEVFNSLFLHLLNPLVLR